MAALTALSGSCACGKCSNAGRRLHSSKPAANTLLVHGHVRARTEVQSWRLPLYVRAAGHGVLSHLISNRWPCHQVHCTLLMTTPKPSGSDPGRLEAWISAASHNFALWGPLLAAPRDVPAPDLVRAFQTHPMLSFQSCRCKQGENMGPACIF